MAFTPEILRGVKTEFEALDRLPAEMKRPGGFGDLGDLPLIVVRRGKTAIAKLLLQLGQPFGGFT